MPTVTLGAWWYCRNGAPFYRGVERKVRAASICSFVSISVHSWLRFFLGEDLGNTGSLADVSPTQHLSDFFRISGFGFRIFYYVSAGGLCFTSNGTVAWDWSFNRISME